MRSNSVIIQPRASLGLPVSGGELVINGLLVSVSGRTRVIVQGSRSGWCDSEAGVNSTQGLKVSDDGLNRGLELHAGLTMTHRAFCVARRSRCQPERERHGKSSAHRQQQQGNGSACFELQWVEAAVQCHSLPASAYPFQEKSQERSCSSREEGSGRRRF